ncbi:MAG: hypothetical protein GYA24_15590 [Candidatus Lokiarchaeota archaeon]|nr:hypothetical protein [Candidatus Lokiarchaeota archaeon]
MGKKAMAPPAKEPPIPDDPLDDDGSLYDLLMSKTISAVKNARLKRGEGVRPIEALEAALLPAIDTLRDFFRAVATGQPCVRPDPSIRAVLADYRYYLDAQRASLVEAGEEPSELFGEYDEAIEHVLQCIDKARRGEGISRVEATRAGAWLRDVPGETILFD